MTRTRILAIIALAATASLTGCSSSGKSSSPTSTTTTARGSTQTPATTTGSWRDAAQGTFGGKPWRVQYAKSTEGGQCFAATGAAQASNTASSLQPGPTHNGAATRCMAPKPGAGTIPFTAFIDGTDANQWVVVGAVTNGVKKVSIVFANKSTTPLNVDPRSHLVIWKGPSSLRPAQLRTDSSVCALKGGSKQSVCDGVAS